MSDEIPSVAASSSATASPSFPYDVFISCSHKDRRWVRSEFVAELKKAGLKVLIERAGDGVLPVANFCYRAPSHGREPTKVRRGRMPATSTLQARAPRTGKLPPVCSARRSDRTHTYDQAINLCARGIAGAPRAHHTIAALP